MLNKIKNKSIKTLISYLRKKNSKTQINKKNNNKIKLKLIYYNKVI